MISRDDILWLFRLILEREPDNEATIEHFQKEFKSVGKARAHLLTSNEYFRSSIIDPVVYQPSRQASFSSKNLAIACIVKNEERHISDMLISVLPIARFVSLVDTGSSDDTVKLARQVLEKAHVSFSINTIDFVHFSHARNVALDAVPEDIEWTLMLDADERIVDADYLKLHQLMDCKSEIDAWCLPRYNFLDQAKLRPVLHYPDYQKRLVRNRRNNPIRYIGLVHETLVNVENFGLAPMCDSNRTGCSGGPHIHHFGLVDQDAEREAVKARLYAELTRLAN